MEQGLLKNVVFIACGISSYPHTDFLEDKNFPSIHVNANVYIERIG